MQELLGAGLEPSQGPGASPSLPCPETPGGASHMRAPQGSELPLVPGNPRRGEAGDREPLQVCSGVLGATAGDNHMGIQAGIPRQCAENTELWRAPRTLKTPGTDCPRGQSPPVLQQGPCPPAAASTSGPRSPLEDSSSGRGPWPLLGLSCDSRVVRWCPNSQRLTMRLPLEMGLRRGDQVKARSLGWPYANIGTPTEQ